jgi:hypothetical protein
VAACVLLAALAGVPAAAADRAKQSPAQLQATAEAKAWWKSQGVTLLTVFRNGQCTDWASRKRPDIVERVEEAAYAAKLLHKPFPKVDFVAKDWAAAATAAGLTVSPTPVKGAIAVWQPGVEGALGTGHVGYVESVGKGAFRVSEENFGKPYRMDVRTLSTAPVSGRVFIYPQP